MAEILIEGASPNSMIAVGERRRVETTPLVRNLIRHGFARVIREPRPEPAPEPDVAVLDAAVQAPVKRRRTRSPKPDDTPDTPDTPDTVEAAGEE